MTPYEIAATVVPTERQIQWQKTEFYGFINYGLPTFTNTEWTNGEIGPQNFVPDEFDAAEWVQLFKDAGFKGMVLNVKHHDGFCLWCSESTMYSVKNALNWDVENRDIVAALAEECKKEGLKFGISISPLDRNSSLFGSGEAYNNYFKSLLREVLSNYGEIFYVRFDGANEPAKDGKIQEYDWIGYYDVVRECQPGAVIALVGPDVRWYGNEWGVIRPNEWSVVPERYSIYSAFERSKQPQKKRLFKREKDYELDIGSRKAIKKDNSFIWYPCEVCLSIRDRWFYHKEDEYTAKTKDKLQKLYLETVGANCAFMLGVPPTKTGKFSEMDSQILRAFGVELKRSYKYKVSQIGTVEVSSQLSDEFCGANLLDEDENKTWKPAKGDEKPEITITLSQKDMFDKLQIQEHIASGQHIESYEIYLDKGDGKFEKAATGGVVGYKRIHKITPVEVIRVKLKITSFRGALELESVTMY